MWELDTMPLTLAASSFVNEMLLPRVASDVDRAVRGLSASQLFAEGYVARGIVDVAVTVGSDLRLPERWSSDRVCEMRYGLFATPYIARTLGREPSEADVRNVPFVAPIWPTEAGEIVLGNDQCPVPRDERTIAHEVESIRLACLVAAETDALVFGPIVAAHPIVSLGGLVELNVPGWSVVEQMYLACNESTVSTELRHLLASIVRSVFEAPFRVVSGVVSVSESDALRRLASKAG
jgi:hypothetical protein